MTLSVGKKAEIIGVGITGLVGSRIVELLCDKYEFTNLSLETGVDITNPSTLEVIRKSSRESIVFHLAAKADVDECEKDKSLGKDGAAWKINVEGTRNVVEACQEAGRKIIYVSTDFVFDGEKEEYSELDAPNPVNWYARTKYEGEEIVKNSGLSFVIMRLAYPYRAHFDAKLDFVRAIMSQFEKGKKIKAITDHVMTPTFIDDIAYAFDRLIESDASGIYHVVGSNPITPYDAACKIAEVFKYNPSLVEKTTREDFFKGRAQRPFRLYLNNDKISKLNVTMRTFEEGLEEMKKQMESTY